MQFSNKMPRALLRQCIHDANMASALTPDEVRKLEEWAETAIEFMAGTYNRLCGCPLWQTGIVDGEWVKNNDASNQDPYVKWAGEFDMNIPIRYTNHILVED